MRVKILGVCGSPIKGGNTEALLDEALKAAAQVPGVETEKFLVAKKKIRGCLHCNWCVNKQASAPPDKFCAQTDGVNPIYPKMLEMDGLIIASPVYLSNISWQTHALFHRMRVFLEGERYRGKSPFANKVVAGIVVAWHRNAGGEGALSSIYGLARIFNGLIVARGVNAVSSLQGLGWRDREHPEDKLLALRDPLSGAPAAQRLGRTVAETARKLKVGEEALARMESEATAVG